MTSVTTWVPSCREHRTHHHHHDLKRVPIHTDYTYTHNLRLKLAYFTENDTLYAAFQRVVMSEVTFAKQFLATADKRPIKLPADHVSDPRKGSGQSPFTLPKQTHPFPRPLPPSTSQLATKNAPLTATLKPMRGGGESVTIEDLTLDSTIHDIKTLYAARSGLVQDKVKVLLNKKPAADLKTLRELGVEGGRVELGVMVMGGGGTTPSVQSPVVEKGEPAMAVPVEESGGEPMEVDKEGAAPGSEKALAEAELTGDAKGGETAKGGDVGAMLESQEFWGDLGAFLTQRLRDQKEGERLVGVFREAYGKSKV
ncbi:hypothetical protein LTR08_008121 [Meristemomyces frigidus]|nr:hypothetical protein LTR08_008121 [Meristemomyces frigidus]